MKRKVLVFISGPVPTEADRALAAKLNTAMFRNADQVQPGENPEKCTHVAGAVPRNYFKNAYGEPIDGVEVLKTFDAPAPAAAPVVETAETRPDAPAAGTQEAGSELPPAAEAPVVNVDSSSTIAAIKAELEVHGIAIPAGVTKKADLLALFPQ